jgi:hypothetical protein
MSYLVTITTFTVDMLLYTIWTKVCLPSISPLMEHNIAIADCYRYRLLRLSIFIVELIRFPSNLAHQVLILIYRIPMCNLRDLKLLFHLAVSLKHLLCMFNQLLQCIKLRIVIMSINILK